MKKVKVILIGAIAALLITAASVTVLAAPGFKRVNMQSSCPASSAICDGTGRQSCDLKEDCPYFEDKAKQDNKQQAGRGSAQRQGCGAGQGRGNGQGRMGGGNGACRMA